ncbi:Uncharacterised protein [Chlamydia trachomatis]|nr:Uncharacterised protein [Chlamydia trachomatis]
MSLFEISSDFKESIPSLYLETFFKSIILSSSKSFSFNKTKSFFPFGVAVILTIK